MSKSKKNILFAITLIVLIIFMVPFFVLINNTFKPTPEFIKAPFSLPAHFTLENYSIAIERMDFWRALFNTAFITVFTVIINMLIGSMTGYLFARKRWKINKVVFGMFLASMVAPFQVYMIPLVRIYAGTFGLSNNLLMVVYIAVGLNLPFAVFLYKGFTEGIPEELDEAARIDGATRARVFVTMTIPMSKPIVIYTALVAFMAPWCDYVFASYVAFGHDESYNVAVAMTRWVWTNDYQGYFTRFCAGGVLVAIPVTILFMCLQKYYVEGVTGGAVKG